MPTPAETLRTAMTADPGRPAVTFYDDATGERVELSVATLDNWVAKTANLLVDGLGAPSGGTVGVLLPCHWLAPVWLLAAWTAGQTVVLGAEAAAADVLVAGPDGLAAAEAGPAGEVVGVSLLPLGRPFASPPPGRALDYAAEVPAYGDRFVASAPAGGGTPALGAEGRTWTSEDVVARAAARAAELGLGAGDRLLTARAPVDAEAVLDLALVPLLTGGAVLRRHPDDERTAATAAQERVAVAVGADGSVRRS